MNETIDKLAQHLDMLHARWQRAPKDWAGCEKAISSQLPPDASEVTISETPFGVRFASAGRVHFLRVADGCVTHTSAALYRGGLRRLKCACCGEYAGRWYQHHNQDIGYGICRRSVDWLLTDRDMPAAELRDLYGEEGINYAPAARLVSLPADPVGFFNTDGALWCNYREVYPTRALEIKAGCVTRAGYTEALARFADDAHAARTLRTAGYHHWDDNGGTCWWP